MTIVPIWGYVKIATKTKKRKQTPQMQDGGYTRNLNGELKLWQEVIRKNLYLPEDKNPIKIAPTHGAIWQQLTLHNPNEPGNIARDLKIRETSKLRTLL